MIAKIHNQNSKLDLPTKKEFSKTKMAYYITTPIGRTIYWGLTINQPSIKGYKLYLQDSILMTLYNDQYAMFSDGQTPRSLMLLASGIGLDQNLTKYLCAKLIGKGLIEPVMIGPTTYYKITENGKQFVELQGDGQEI